MQRGVIVIVTVTIAAAIAIAAAACSSAPSQPAVTARVAGSAGSSAVDARRAAAPVPDAAAPLHVVDAPMAWSARRAQLTLDYRRRHSDPAATDLTITPRAIVLHYTSGGSLAGTRAYFDNPTIEASRAALARAGAANVSAHFIVDRDGTIYRLQPETRYARHCIGLNHLAIGIENVGDGARWPLTDAQVAADAALVRDLVHRFPITHLFGHFEIMKLRTHDLDGLYVERDPAYFNDKPDPGAAFLARVRADVADLQLRGLPDH